MTRPQNAPGVAAPDAPIGHPEQAAEFVLRVLAATETSDAGAVRAELAAAELVLGLGGCLDDVLFPAMHQIGALWQLGRCDVDQERLTTEAARAWLDHGLAAAPAPDPALASVILAGGPTDLHTIGLEGLALLLRRRSRSCRLLGARTSAASLSTAAVATGAGAVVVVSQLNGGRRKAIPSIEAIASLGVPIFYAGNAFSSVVSRKNLPGVYLGPKLQDASELIDASLGGG